MFFPCRRNLHVSRDGIKLVAVGCKCCGVLRCLEVVLFPVASGIGACLFVRTTLLLLLLLLLLLFSLYKRLSCVCCPRAIGEVWLVAMWDEE